jgi:hypothetical protein
LTHSVPPVISRRIVARASYGPAGSGVETSG